MIEPLEARIAPASVLTFTDVDGDKITVKSSAGNIAAPGIAVLVDTSFGQQLAQLNLTDFSFQGTSISTSVQKGPNGDGLVNIGFINAAGRDLGTVDIKGDLAQLTAGDGTTATGFGVKALKVRSLGHHGTATGGAAGLSGSIEVQITGALGSLNVLGDVDQTFVFVTGVGRSFDPHACIGTVKVGGSIFGGATDSSGNIEATGGLGSVSVAHDIRGGKGSESGAIEALGTTAAKSITIGGSVFGGAGISSGVVFIPSGVGSLSIKGSLSGGSGPSSGSISTDTLSSSVVVGSVNIAGSVIGGSANGAGSIKLGKVASLSIGHDVVGGSITGSANLRESGFVQVGEAGSITIGGSVISGVDTSTGSLAANGEIAADRTIGRLAVKGSLVGNTGDGTPGNLSPVFILAGGFTSLPSGATKNLVIGSLSVGGSVINARILGGYYEDIPAIARDANAQIGSVSVAGDWIASDLVAGVRSSAGTAVDNSFGDNDDVAITDPNANPIISRIASISITGAVFGSAVVGDHFGFVAQEIGSFKAAGYTAPLTSGKNFLGVRLVTADVTILEVA